MNNTAYFEISTLQQRLANAQKKIERFESGEIYKKMQDDYFKMVRHYERQIFKLNNQLANAHSENKRIFNMWYTVADECVEEAKKKRDEDRKECQKLLDEIERLKAENEELKLKNKELLKEKYEAQSEALDEKEKNAALTARINKDYTNSSKPSSSSPNHKTIHNSREKTGRKQGGQKGHEYYPRKKHEPDFIGELETPDEYLDTSKYKATGRVISKQLVFANLVVTTIEYRADEYRNLATGQRVHAPFPEGVVNDVNYDGTVKAMAYLLNNGCNTSIKKTKQYLYEISNEQLDLSTGLISDLSRQFSEKTEKERDEIFLRLAASDILHTDFTFGRVGGKTGTVIISTNPEGEVLYQAREKKGDEGIKGSPVEFFSGTLVSDHEAAIRKHGSRHQECLAHVKRYILGSIENEPNLKWNKRMLKWIKDAIAYWHRVNEGEEYDERIVRKLISRYDSIIRKARREYEYEPPTDYYREGYNTYKRLEENKEEYILFLRDPSVPPSNNAAERAAREYKRKSAQVTSFRSPEGAAYYCDGLSVMKSLKNKGKNIFKGVTQRFNAAKA